MRDYLAERAEYQTVDRFRDVLERAGIDAQSVAEILWARPEWMPIVNGFLARGARWKSAAGRELLGRLAQEAGMWLEVDRYDELGIADACLAMGMDPEEYRNVGALREEVRGGLQALLAEQYLLFAGKD